MRRAQLVTPFGVGAMSILVNGTSVITAGLDHWYKTDDAAVSPSRSTPSTTGGSKQRLACSEFRLPPDYRLRRSGSSDNRNLQAVRPGAALPALVLLHVLQAAQAEHADPAAARVLPGRMHRSAAYKPRMSQVPFVDDLSATATSTTSRSTSGCTAR